MILDPTLQGRHSQPQRIQLTSAFTTILLICLFPPVVQHVVFLLPTPQLSVSRLFLLTHLRNHRLVFRDGGQLTRRCYSRLKTRLGLSNRDVRGRWRSALRRPRAICTDGDHACSPSEFRRSGRRWSCAAARTRSSGSSRRSAHCRIPRPFLLSPSPSTWSAICMLGAISRVQVAKRIIEPSTFDQTSVLVWSAAVAAEARRLPKMGCAEIGRAHV